MKNLKLFAQTLTLLTGLLFFAACQQEEIASPNSSIGERDDSSFSNSTAPSMTVFGLSPENQIYKYNTNPVELQNVAPIKGLRPGEQMLAIDTRPSTGEVFGVSSLDIIYKVDPMSGVATSVGQFSPSLDGTQVGFDFIPKEDRIQLMTDNGQSLKIDPNTGAVVGSTTVNSTPTQTGVNSLAHSFGTATSSATLFDIDGRTGDLFKFDQFGNPTVVGPTGLTMRGDGGFDIAKDGTALATFDVKSEASEPNSWDQTVPDDGGSKMFVVDLKTGEATSLGSVRPMIGMAIK